jgi:hypothetical protein
MVTLRLAWSLPSVMPARKVQMYANGVYLSVLSQKPEE